MEAAKSARVATLDGRGGADAFLWLCESEIATKVHYRHSNMRELSRVVEQPFHVATCAKRVLSIQHAVE
jgi:hypothetical protein